MKQQLRIKSLKTTFDLYVFEKYDFSTYRKQRTQRHKLSFYLNLRSNDFSERVSKYGGRRVGVVFLVHGRGGR